MATAGLQVGFYCPETDSEIRRLTNSIIDEWELRFPDRIEGQINVTARPVTGERGSMSIGFTAHYKNTDDLNAMNAYLNELVVRSGYSDFS